MKFKLRNDKALLLGGLLLLGAASSQEIKTSLPLTSVGSNLAWTVGDQDLTLDVPVQGRVKLELYSPRLDQRDYRSDTYYGDEQYDGNASAVTTTFTLSDSSGRVLLRKTYQPGQHNWDTFLDQGLPAGKYRLRAATDGNGKNTFALRLTGSSAAISADNLTVNVHSQEWLAAVNVATDGPGYSLRMYDGDGATELEARLRDEAGRVYPVAVSKDRQWAEIKLPEGAGRYTLELRQPAEAKQYSNTVGFALTRQGQAEPITLSKVDQTGLLKVTAQLLFPTGTLPTQAAVTVQGQSETLQLPVDGETQRRVLTGNYNVSAQPVTGADVSVTPSVNVPRGGVGEVLVQVRPQVTLSLQTDKTEVCAGDVVGIVARASSDYQGELPLSFGFNAGGLNLKGAQPELQTLKPGQTFEWRTEAVAAEAGTYTLEASLPQWGQSQRASVKVLPNATALQLRRAALPASRVGDTVTVELNLTNTSQAEVPFSLSDEAPGLEPIDEAKFRGTLKPGESRTLKYRARVVSGGDVSLNATLDTPSCPLPQRVTGSLSVAPATPPTVARRSTVTLPFDVPGQATGIIIAHQPPAGAEYVVGSAKLDGKPLPDPLVGAKGRLYWSLSAQPKGKLSYDLAHSSPLPELPKPALMIRLAGDRSEVLQGNFDKADWQQAAAMKPVIPEGTENPGAIKLPLDKQVIRIRDRISVTVEAPIGSSAPLTVNGKAVSSDLIGENTQDPQRGVQRLTYVGVPLQLGPNTISFNGSTIQVMRAGPAAALEVTPENLVADGSTPIRLKFKVRDAYGNTAALDKLTVGPSLEPYVADADAGRAGYQIALNDGEGVLELRPQSAPTTLDLKVELGSDVKTYRYQVTPDLHPVGVGMFSATLGVHSDFHFSDDFSWQGRLYSENPIGEGKLYIAADRDGLPITDDHSALQRYSVYGDASTESVPLQGYDPVAAVYDHPTFQVAYRRMQMPLDVLPVTEQYTALTFRTKWNPTVSGFVAALPTDRVNVLITPDGTRLLRLKAPAAIEPGTESLEMVVYDRNGGKELSRKLLLPNTDYILDYSTGVVTLLRALDPFDYDLNTVRVAASYRLDSPKADRKLAYGVQIKRESDNYTVGAAAVHLDDQTTFGVRATYDKDDTHAQASLAYAGGLQASADYASSWANRWGKRDSAQLSARYQNENYDGVAPFSSGWNVNAKYVKGLSSVLAVVAEAEYHDTPVLASAVTNTLSPDDHQGGSVSLRSDYHFNPFSVGLGAKYAFGDTHGFGAVGSFGYHAKPFDIDLVHTLPVSGNLNNETDVTARYYLTEHVALGLKDKIVWGVGQAVALQLDMALGGVNYAIGYDLPNASGTGNRARFGVNTSLPLNTRLSLGVHGSALYNANDGSTEGAAGADLNYKTDVYSATIGGDVVRHSGSWGTVLRGGITGSVNPNLVLTADGLMQLGADQDGSRLNFGYAYRNWDWNSLGYLRYQSGSLAGNEPKLTAGLSAEYRRPQWGIRAGIDTRELINDGDSFTAQGYLSGKYYFNDWLAAGAWGMGLWQPSTSTHLYAYGLEGSVRALPGLWLSAGYNLRGFEGLDIPNIYTRKGFYLRVDLTVDETLGKSNK